MGPQFFETVMGRRFFESQVPSLIKAINANTEAIKESVISSSKKTSDDGRYRIAREVAIENTMNAMECDDVDVKSLSQEVIEKIHDQVEDLLANDDVYNTCYNRILWQVLKNNGVV